MKKSIIAIRLLQFTIGILSMSFGLMDNLIDFLRMPSRFGFRLCISGFYLTCALSGLGAQQSNSSLSLAERIRFEHLTIEQGLSENTVLSILQDHKGFMWFATQEGLNKYDGYRFTVYKYDPSDSTSLSANYVEVVYEDRAGTLWVGTSGGGIDRFDRRQEQFTRFSPQPKIPYSVTWFYEDTVGRFWIGTQGGGLLQMDRETGRFAHYRHDPDVPHSLSNDFLWQIIQDPLEPNKLWVATENGLNRLNCDTGQFTHFFHIPDHPNSLSHNDIRALDVDHTGTLWVGTWGGGLNRFNRNSGTFAPFEPDANNPYSLSSERIFDIQEDPTSPGTLWLATYGGGLDRLNSKTERFTHFRHDPENHYSVGNDNLKYIYADRSGSLWIGTWNRGVSKIDRGKKPFNPFSRLDGLSAHSVFAIAGDDASGNTVWIGTFGGGLNRVDLKTGKVTDFRHDPNDPHSLSYDRVRSNTIDHTGTLWVGTDKGLNRFDDRTERFTRFEHDPDNPNSLGPHAVTVISEDPISPGTLWLGLYDGGLQRLTVREAEGQNREQAHFVNFVHDPENPHSLSSNRIQSIHIDHSGTLWVGTNLGLNRFDRDTGKFTRFVHDPSNPHSLGHNSVLAIHEGATSKDGTAPLWVGTEAGLDRFDRNSSRADTGQFTHYTEKDGLPSAVIYGILEDGHGRLWLSTNKGLSRFDPGTNVFRNYEMSDGLQSNEFEGGAYYESRSGWMFFGGINGFNVFHPDSIKDNPHIPPVVISDFQIFNKSAKIGEKDSPLRRAISETDELVLSHKQSVFSFEFAALDYTGPQRNLYAYKMEGFDENWHYVGTRRFATYTNLDPGKYVFRVKASNNDGVWNEEGTSIKITIMPPWWRTGWAYTLYAVIMLGLLYGIRRYELNRIHLKNLLKIEHIEAEKLKELDAMKSRFFANISHEFRTPLTLILGPINDLLEAVKGNQAKKNLRMMRRHARHLLQLINQLLDLSKLESGKMRLQATCKDVIPVLRGITSGFQSMAEKKKIDLQFHSEVDALDLYVDQEKFEKIFYNLLSNAVKFTPQGGKISVQLVASSVQLPVSREQLPANRPVTDHCLLITVRDTGIGIPKDKLPYIFDRFYQVTEGHAGSISESTRDFEGTGIGLSLAKELVELHHGTIEIISEEGWGTEAIVHLPLGRAHLQDDEVVETLTAAPTKQAPQMPAEFDEVKEAPQESDELAEVLEQSEEQRIILVVEDNLDMRSYIRQYLEGSYQVLEARDGREGLEQALATIPDLVISDVMMPKRDGYALCRALKTDEKTCHIPVILLTAKADAEDKLAGLEIGADDYLTKPFDAKELSVRVKNLIQLRQQLQEKFSSVSLLDVGPALENKLDRAFVKRLQKIIEENLEDETFGVEELAEKLKLSRTQLHRKIRALTNRPASLFIRFVRLHHARKLLEQNELTINEVAYRVGFSSHAYFSKCFREEFGCTPKEFVRGKRS